MTRTKETKGTTERRRDGNNLEIGKLENVKIDRSAIVTFLTASMNLLGSYPEGVKCESKISEANSPGCSEAEPGGRRCRLKTRNERNFEGKENLHWQSLRHKYVPTPFRRQ